MKLLLTNILLLFSTNLLAQTEIGVGIISINFDDKTVLKFYEDTTDIEPAKTIKFFNDESINSWSIKNLEEEKEWLKPEVLWLDYSSFIFRCLVKEENWCQIIANNESGKTYWLKQTKVTDFKDWEKYLQNMFSIGKLEDEPQEIRTSPNDNSSVINYFGYECFQVKRMKGDWIEISTPEYCIKDKSDNKTKLESGWIRWKDGNKLLIQYYLTR
jgi:hypothetical protein